MEQSAITQQVRGGLLELLRSAKVRPGELFVLGCSTSAVAGYEIGTQSSADTAAAIMDAILPIVRESGLFLAVQCCEHLNRALVVERQAVEKYGLCEVFVKPWLHAGGAMAEKALERFDEPVLVEDIRGLAAAGMDIGGTFIGMHMRPVVVPIHGEHKHVGEAVLTMARTRPKYIGGPRAQYQPVDAH